MARIQQLQITGAQGVPMGVAGTGEAVMFDNNVTFDPVKFAEDRRAEVKKDLLIKQEQRKRDNDAIMSNLVAKPEGMYYAQDVNDVFANLRLETAPNIDKIMAGNTPEALAFYQKRADALALNQVQKAVSLAIQSDLDLLKKNPNKFDSESVKLLTEIASGKKTLQEAAEAYKNNGTVLQPAYDVEDVIKSMNITPSLTSSTTKDGQIVVTQSYSPIEIEEEINRFKSNPQNKEAWDYISNKFGGEQAVVDYIVSDFDARSKTTTKNAPKAGVSNARGRAIYYDNGDGDYQIGVSLGTRSGAILPAGDFINSSGVHVYGSAQRLVEDNQGNQYYQILVPKSSAYSKEITKEEYFSGNFDRTKFIPKQGDDNKYIEVATTESKFVPVSQANTAIIQGQTGINPVEILEQGKGKTKRAVSTTKTTAPKPKMSLEQYRKLPLAERMKIPVNERPTQ